MIIFADMTTIKEHLEAALENLMRLIEIPSFSGQESGTAEYIFSHLVSRGISASRVRNNVWAANEYFDAAKPTLLLCSHHDTVRPASGYTLDPHLAVVKDGRIYGLGSNDAGASLVSLAEAFVCFYSRKDMKYNLVFSAVAEEECSGENGVSALLPHLPAIDCAVVGEPTGMRMAVAEKSLIVVDCTAHGRSGHAARDEGENAIYKAVKDIEAIRDYRFPRVSEMLGPVKMTVTMVSAGTQHNVIPDECEFTVDIRTTDAYTNEEIVETLSGLVGSQVRPRNMKRRASSIAADHPLVAAGRSLGLETFGSPTLSDQALLSCPSVKIGPGESARSHTADEYVLVQEIEDGIRTYLKLLEKLVS